jgi:hypothetical protein
MRICSRVDFKCAATAASVLGSTEGKLYTPAGKGARTRPPLAGAVMICTNAMAHTDADRFTKRHKSEAIMYGFTQLSRLKNGTYRVESLESLPVAGGSIVGDAASKSGLSYCICVSSSDPAKSGLISKSSKIPSCSTSAFCTTAGVEVRSEPPR